MSYVDGPASGWPAGVDRVILPEVDSTNAHAARIGAAGPVWVMAQRQTAARGRRGRPWAMPAGSFAATLAMRETDAARAGLRSFVAALALRDAFAAVGVPDAALTLKWPNDVLLNGGKVAGILLEAGGSGLLAIGIGVNLAAAPSPDEVEPGALRPVSLLGETGLTVAPETFLDHLAAAFARWDAQLTTFGFAPLRTAWLARAARLGQAITARTARDSHHGTFETLDDTGALVLRTATGRVTLPAADVFF